MKQKNSTTAQTLDNVAMGISYLNAVAAMRMVGDAAVLDLPEDDYDFLIQDKLWLARDRARARRCIEAAVYGAIDYVGFPRFAVPAEFVAAAIAYYVHPINIMSASLIMEGAEFTENIINGVERPLKAREIFAHVVRLKAGNPESVNAMERNVRQHLLLSPDL